jgi:kynurenine formamidase
MRIVDLTLAMRPGMRGVNWSAYTTVAEQGWNTTLLELYSHAGTHCDAPRHFLDAGATLETVPLERCVGPALVADLSHLPPRALITVADLGPLAERIGPGSRLLLRTGWSAHAEQPDYRTHFPRVSLELAEWLAAKPLALLGVEPPSVADVGDKDEVTAVHRALLRAGIVIVEGLANLDQLRSDEVTFVALPLKLVGGDGSPVRAIAIEDQGDHSARRIP